MPRTTRTVARKKPLMMLRDHPKIHWPPGLEPDPPWIGPYREVPDPAHIVLAKVQLVEASRHTPPHLALTGDYRRKLYHTTVGVEGRALLANLRMTLERCVGETIEKVGSRYVDRNLNLQ